MATLSFTRFIKLYLPRQLESYYIYFTYLRANNSQNYLVPPLSFLASFLGSAYSVPAAAASLTSHL